MTPLRPKISCTTPICGQRSQNDGHSRGVGLRHGFFSSRAIFGYNGIRHQRNGPQLIGFDATEALAANDGTSDPQLVCARLSELEAVWAAIERLPVLYREAVVLRDIQGCSYKEMAAIMACPVGTIMSRLARARERLKQSLAEPDPHRPDHRTLRME